MKKITTVLSVVIFAVVLFAFSAENSGQEMSSIQKIMRERAQGLVLMNKLLNGRRWKMIVQSADNMAIETKKTGKGLTNSEAKEITLAISSLAQDVSSAAMSKDGAVVKTKLGEIKGKCQQCHIKFRK